MSEQSKEFQEGEDLSDVASLRDRLIDQIGGKKYEVLLVAFIDTAKKLIKVEQMAEGDDNQVSVEHDKIMARALELKAGSMVLIHNHPNEDSTPSWPDWYSTFNLRFVSRMFGGPDLDDHLVVSNHDVHSMKRGKKL